MISEATPAQLRETAKAIGPFSVDRAGYIWMSGKKGGQTLLAQIRGWGYLTGRGDGALGLPEKEAVQEQLRWGDMIVEALNEYRTPPDRAIEAERILVDIAVLFARYEAEHDVKAERESSKCDFTRAANHREKAKVNREIKERILAFLNQPR